MLTKICFDKAKFWIDSKGILYCKHFNRDIHWKLEEEDVEKYMLAILFLAIDVERPIIFDLRDVQGTYTILAARMIAKDPTLKKIIISEAFVVNSMAVRLLINAFKRIFEPSTPFKIFSSMKDAQEYSLNRLELSKESSKNKLNKILNPHAL